MHILAWIHWNPNRVCFYFPIINHPIVWYGILFALGFFASYGVTIRLFLSEIYTKRGINDSHVKNWPLLWRLCQKYPSLFPEKLIQDQKPEDQLKILSLISKYISEKTLPLPFYKKNILNVYKKALDFSDRFVGCLIIGLIIGARVGYILFYGWPMFLDQPLNIFKLWTGGLASHGASVGLLLALIVFTIKQKKKGYPFSFLHLLDILALSAGLMSFFIRMGNFVNQEIIGKFSLVPWAIIFESPFDGSSVVPRHPVQLYEGLFYLIVFLGLYFLWVKNKIKAGSGFIAGLFMLLVFSFRFFIEFFKEPQGIVLPEYQGLLMGQYLSIPFVIAGLALVVKGLKDMQLSLRSQS